MTSLIGQSLGRYQILDQLGEGGMATVYKAFDTHLECDVAVKVIRLDRLPPAMADKALQRFKREARLLAKLTHPNIVKIVDYGEFENQPYLVMVLLPGGNLKQKMTGQPMPADQAARLLLPIARALEYAHGQGMIHRDIKPSNIMLTASGEPMLTDFGVAKLFDTENTAELTGTSMGVGTPEYMAPEQATSSSVDRRADVYALGVVLYELLTGRKPYQADTPLAVLFKHSTEPLPRPSQFVRGLSDTAEKVLLKALAKAPEDRYQDMGAFASALENLVTGGSEPGVPTKKGKPGRAERNAPPPVSIPAGEPPQGRPPRPRRKLAWLFWLLGSIGFVGIAVVGVYIGILATPDEHFLIGGGPTDTPTRTRVPSTPTRTQVPPTWTPTEIVYPLPSFIEDVLVNPQITYAEDFTNWKNQDWDYSDNVRVINDGSDDRMELPAPTENISFLVSPTIQAGQGIQISFMYSGSPDPIEFFLGQGSWDTPSYKRFGGSLTIDNLLLTNVWSGQESIYSLKYMGNSFAFLPDVWYGMFIGIGKDDDSTYIKAWDWMDQNHVQIFALTNGQYWASGDWNFFIQVFSGSIQVDDFMVISFDSINW